MASSFTTSFGIEKIATGEQAGVWGTTTNFNIDILDRIASFTSVALSGTTQTLTVREASPGAGTENLQDGMYRVIKFTGALGGNNTVTIAPNTSKAWFIFENATTDSGSSGPYSVILSQGAGANITVQNGKNAIVYCDGAGSGAAVFNALNDLQIATLEVTGAAAVDGLLTAGASVAVTGNVTTTGTVEPAGDTAADDNAAIGYTVGEGLILTGQGSTNDVTIKNDADGEVMGVLTGSTTAAFTGQVTATGFTGTLDGILGSGTAAAVSATTIGATGLVTAAAKLDLNGTELVLDADADTSITADTDDTIDIRIAGADDFQFTPNTFTVLSGSTLTVASGATIVNSGTATNFGTDSESAYAGVLQANANFVDQVIFGPSVDGVPWNGVWDKAGVYSSLMLATIEDEGSNTEINIWDLTQQSAGVISTTPLATVDLANAATPTSIAASMGYLIVGSEDGIAIIDPHSGAWAERTVGWPRTLSSTTLPAALTNNDVKNVDAGFSNQPTLDTRTGGYMPTFAVSYGTGADLVSVLKNDGVVYDKATTARGSAVEIVAGRLLYGEAATTSRLSPPIDSITADDWFHAAFIDNSGNEPYGIAAEPDVMDSVGDFIALGAAEGLSLSKGVHFTEQDESAQLSRRTAIASITRAYNTGYAWFFASGIWLANSKTADRTALSNTLTENGTVTEGVVETSAELLGYSGWSASNNLTRASDSQWDVITTGAVYMTIWCKTTNASGNDFIFGYGNSGATIEFLMFIGGDGTVAARDDGATAQVQITSQPINDNVWHKIDFVRVSSTERYLYIDGVLSTSSTTDAGSLSSSGNLPLYIGVDPADGSTSPAENSTLSLARLHRDAPTATEVRQMYDDEKGMFVASAECLLQSGSTDAVLDVSIDPLGSGKVIVTQTDAITIFDGLVVDSKPTVNSGASEKGKLWGALRSEQNAANAYVTAPATDQRQVNEMVRGLASDLPAGPDLGKAKAWVVYNQATNAILASYNVSSVSDDFTGGYSVNWAVPFKSDNAQNPDYVAFITTNETRFNAAFGTFNSTKIVAQTRNDAGGYVDATINCVIAFGELENE